MKILPTLVAVAAGLAAAGTPLSAQTRPDNRALLTGLTAAAAKPGDSVEVTDETRNLGGRPTVSTEIEFWLNSRSDTTNGGIRLSPATKQVVQLNPNGVHLRRTGERKLTIPRGVTNRGPQFIIGYVRPVAMESNIGNNLASVPINITPPVE